MFWYFIIIKESLNINIVKCYIFLLNLYSSNNLTRRIYIKLVVLNVSDENRCADVKFNKLKCISLNMFIYYYSSRKKWLTLLLFVIVMIIDKQFVEHLKENSKQCVFHEVMNTFFIYFEELQTGKSINNNT